MKTLKISDESHKRLKIHCAQEEVGITPNASALLQYGISQVEAGEVSTEDLLDTYPTEEESK